MCKFHSFFCKFNATISIRKIFVFEKKVGLPLSSASGFFEGGGRGAARSVVVVTAGDKSFVHSLKYSLPLNL
jgi:hypothetical protein